MNQNTKISDMLNSRQEFLARLARRLSTQLIKAISETKTADYISSLDVIDTSSDEFPFEVMYGYKIDDVCMRDTIQIKYNNTVSEIVSRICKYVNYSIQLAIEYPDEFRLWLYMREHNDINGKRLCNFIEWPKTTVYSSGGGDYEVKRVKSEYVPQYISRCDGLIESLSAALSNAIGYKKRLEDIVKELKEDNVEKK